VLIESYPEKKEAILRGRCKILIQVSRSENRIASRRVSVYFADKEALFTALIQRTGTAAKLFQHDFPALQEEPAVF